MSNLKVASVSILEEARKTKQPPLRHIFKAEFAPPVKFTTRADALRILDEVAEKHGTSRLGIIGRQQSRRLSKARREFFSRMLHETTWSHEHIARFCDRDRTTVIHGANLHDKENRE